MNRAQEIFIGLTAMAVSLSGCVTTGKYKALEGKLGQETTKSAGLEQEVARLKTENEAVNKEKEDLAKTHEETKSQYDQMMSQLQQEVQQGELKITQYQNMLSVDVAEQIFFASGSAKLKAKGQDVLKKVGAALAKYPDKTIRVVGHTDNVPLGAVGQNVFPSNWELSVIRATNVVRFLQDQCAIPPERLMAAGRSQYEPVAPNETPEGRQKNRRIEIMLIDKGIK